MFNLENGSEFLLEPNVWFKFTLLLCVCPCLSLCVCWAGGLGARPELLALDDHGAAADLEREPCPFPPAVASGCS